MPAKAIETIPREFLRVEITNHELVELLDLTASMQALGSQFIRHARGAGDLEREDVRLYIREIRSGSIIADLVSIARQASFLVSDLNILVSFGSSIKTAYDYFLGRADNPPTELQRADLENYAKIVEPVAKDKSAQFNLSVNDGSTVVMHMHLPSIEANAVQNAISRQLMLKPGDVENDFFEEEALYFYQARDDAKAKTGDKGIIERFSERPVKVRFASEEIKRKILELEENIFRLVFIVDVRVHKVGDRVAAYTIYNVRDWFEKP